MTKVEDRSDERDALAALLAAQEDALIGMRSLEAAVEQNKDLIIKRVTEAEAVQLHRLSVVAGNVAGLATRTEASLRASLGHDPGGRSSGAVKGLYLDLLESALTGTLWRDGSIEPWGDGTYAPSQRAIGGDWPATAATMIGTARMRNIRTLVERAIAEGVPGDLIEAGAWRGGACIYMRGILAAAGDRTRRVFVADSFRGLPEPDESRYPADAGDIHHTYHALAVSREEVEDNFRRFGLLDDRIVFLEGWFKETLPAAPIDRLAILRLDGDMYESTMVVLEALYSKVSQGGYVVIDDYNLEPCARAVDDFRADNDVTAPYQAIDGAGVWWQVGSAADHT